MSTRVAVVTGANKGIGFGIVRGLCKDFDGDVFLTARDEGRGKAAVKALECEGFKPKFHQLDVTDHSSIMRFKDFLQQNYKGLDVLVNNAGILFNDTSTLPFAAEAAETMNINYFGLLDVCKALFPMLRPHARVCNVSSMAANYAITHCSPEVKDRLTNPDITADELSAQMSQYVKLAEQNKLEEAGLPKGQLGVYGFSKVGVTVLSTIQQKEFDAQGADDIVVNSCSPGYVNTDMTLGKGTSTVEEGVITPLYCALLPPNISSPRGIMLRLKQPVDWLNFVWEMPDSLTSQVSQ